MKLNPKKIVKRCLTSLGIGLIIFVLIIVAFIVYFRIKDHFDHIEEKKVQEKFYEEVKKIPEITITSFQLWEGESIANLSIKNKGTVLIWYGINGIPRLMGIGNYGTSYDCFYTDPSGKKTRYAVTQNLDLSNNSVFEKWFPFKVNTLNDLVTHYGDIIKVISSFPSSPQMVSFSDFNGDRRVVKNPNPSFVLKPYNNNVQCDLYNLLSDSSEN